MTRKTKVLITLFLVIAIWLAVGGFSYLLGSRNLSLLIFLGGANAFSAGGMILIPIYKPIKLKISLSALLIGIIANSSSLIALGYQYATGDIGEPFYVAIGLSLVGVGGSLVGLRRVPNLPV